MEQEEQQPKKRKRRSAYKTEMRETTVEGAIADANAEREALAEEMASWRDNLEEKFSGTSRYDTVSAAANELDSIDEVDTGNLDSDSLSLDVEVGVSVSARKGRGESRATRAGNAAALYEGAASALRMRADELRERETRAQEQEERNADAFEEEPEACEECQGTGKMTPSTAEVSGQEREGWLCDACGHFHAKVLEMENDEDGGEKLDADELGQWAETCDEVAQACEEAAETLNGIEFPGMYG